MNKITIFSFDHSALLVSPSNVTRGSHPGPGPERPVRVCMAPGHTLAELGLLLVVPRHRCRALDCNRLDDDVRGLNHRSRDTVRAGGCEQEADGGPVTVAKEHDALEAEPIQQLREDCFGFMEQ